MARSDAPLFAPEHRAPAQRSLTGSDGPRGGIRIGIGGWIFPAWRGSFYPRGLVQRRELEYASRVLSSIEINSTFYHSPTAKSVDRWREETPDGFVFALKAPRVVGETRRLADAGAAVTRFLDSGITRLGPKLGPINWQFPPWRVFEPDDFAAFLRLLPTEHDGLTLRHAVEVRHPSFACADFAALARAHGVAVVLALHSAYPQIAIQSADFLYVRIMGTQADQALGYSEAALDAWAEHVLHWSQGAASAIGAWLDGAPSGQPPRPREVFCYFISGAKAHNPLAAQALLHRLDARCAPASAGANEDGHASAETDRASANRP